MHAEHSVASADVTFGARLLDEIDVAVIATDLDGLTTYWNKGAEQLYGWTRDEAMNKPLGELIGCGNRQRERSSNGIDAAWEEQMELRHKNGSTFPVSVRLSLIGDAKGQPVGVLGTSANISARVEAESQVVRLRDALAKDRFVLHAQPIIDIASGHVVQHELLIRLQQDDGALVQPLEFLPTAEEHGLILEIDRWVVRQAAQLVKTGRTIAFNFSGASLNEPGFVDVVERELEQAGADPQLLVFEITETALASDEEVSSSFAERLARLGCRLALDDFGTGYGGFTYLKHLPVDFLKIDREFVSDLLFEQRSQLVVRAVVDLAKGGGQRTIAEGVEDGQTLALLREMGVDYAQGHTIGLPSPLCELDQP